MLRQKVDELDLAEPRLPIGPVGPSLVIQRVAPKIASQVYREAERLKGEGITIIAVDQNVRQAMKVADYVYVLELGRNKYEGAKEEFETRVRELIRDWLKDYILDLQYNTPPNNPEILLENYREGTELFGSFRSDLR